DEAEELRDKWGVELGQLWQLGEHRVICGDCTDREVVDRLMNGEKADIIFTDPPYGISKKGVVNDSLKSDEFDQFNTLWLSVLPNKINSSFVCYHSPRTFPSLLIPALEAEWTFERMLWFYRPDKFPAHTWNGWMMVGQSIMFLTKGEARYLDISPADQDTYKYTVKDLGSASGHPTEKIADQCGRIIKHLAGEIFDPFLGSGTTLVACERLNRICYGVEIEPKFIAVTLERWYEMTGEEPILLSDLPT
ncbi:site-specific DNA-methyltransferase, partial [bacterium]|nr:site-specific DNA-methyltransferase [bacterium]